MKKIYFLILFFSTFYLAFSQDYAKLLQSHNWYLTGHFYTVPRTIYLSSQESKDYDSEVKFLANGKYYRKSTLRESHFDSNGNELPEGTVWEDSTITYLIKRDVIKFAFPQHIKEVNEAPVYYFKIQCTKDKGRYDLVPAKPEEFK